MQNSLPEPQIYAPVEPVCAEKLASRTIRLIAAILDTVINTLFTLPALYFTGIFNTIINDTPATPLQYFWALLLGLVIFICTQGVLLVSRQQTIGKYFLKLKIVGIKTDEVSVFRLLGLRYLLFSLIANIPLIGSIIILLDVLLIFRKKHKCLHDTLARTRVIDIG